MSRAILRGEKVVLRALQPEDVARQLRWFRDPDVVRWLQLSEDPPELFTEEAVRERYEALEADPLTKQWRIETLQGTVIGSIELTNVYGLQGRAEAHVMIGEKEYWSGGYGTDAMRCLLRYVFEELDLRRVYLTTDADNARAIRSFEKCGFQREGVLREHRLRFGQPVDMVVMGILKEEIG